jgi:hypothetical protein
MNTIRSLVGRVRRGIRTPVFRTAAAAAALAIALVAALLAQDVRSWRNTLTDDAGRYTISPSAEERPPTRRFFSRPRTASPASPRIVIRHAPPRRTRCWA